MKKIFALSIILLVSGCAGTPQPCTSSTDAVTVPPAQVAIQDLEANARDAFSMDERLAVIAQGQVVISKLLASLITTEPGAAASSPENDDQAQQLSRQ